MRRRPLLIFAGGLLAILGIAVLAVSPMLSGGSSAADEAGPLTIDQITAECGAGGVVGTITVTNTSDASVTDTLPFTLMQHFPAGAQFEPVPGGDFTIDVTVAAGATVTVDYGPISTANVSPDANALRIDTNVSLRPDLNPEKSDSFPPCGPAPTETPTSTPTATNTPTETPVPPTNTPTETPAPPTNTPTETPVPPTNTPTETPLAATSTPTETPVTPTSTPTETPPAATATPTETSVTGPAVVVPTSTPVVVVAGATAAPSPAAPSPTRAVGVRPAAALPSTGTGAASQGSPSLPWLALGSTLTLAGLALMGGTILAGRRREERP